MKCIPINHGIRWVVTPSVCYLGTLPCMISASYCRTGALALYYHFTISFSLFWTMTIQSQSINQSKNMQMNK